MKPETKDAIGLLSEAGLSVIGTPIPDFEQVRQQDLAAVIVLKATISSLINTDPTSTQQDWIFANIAAGTAFILAMAYERKFGRIPDKTSVELIIPPEES